MDQIVYREIEKEDNVKLANLLRSVLKEFGVDQPGTVYTDPTTDTLYHVFQNPDSKYWVALDGEDIVGGCGLYPTSGLPDSCIELVKFYVAASHRGLGIGKKLMNMSLEQAKKQNFNWVYLESLPELDKAVGMYEQAGFKHIPERLGNSGHFACNILMLKDLNEKPL